MAQPPTLKTNLIACWNFDGDSTDDLGNHDGSEVGSPSYPASGNLFDQCLYLPGDGSYVDAGDITTDIFDGSNDVVTFAAWVKLDSDKTYNNLYVFEKEDAFEIRIYVGRIYVYIFDSVTWSEVRTAYYTVDYDTWVHLVVAVDLGSDDLKIYVNGTECSNFWDNCTNVIVDNSNVCKMGISSWDFFDGYIQQALLYNRCFTQSDVDELYNSGDGIKYPFFFPKIFSTFHGVGEFNEAQAIRNDCSDYGTIGYAETLGLSTQLLFNFNPALGSGDINSFSGVLGTIASFQNFSTGLGTGILENLISFSIGDCDHQFNPVGMGLIEQQLNKLQLGASTQSVQTIKLRLLIGTLTSKVQSIVNALRSDSSGISASLNIITEGVQGVQSLKGSFSFGDVIKGVHGILNNLSASATGQQAVKNIIVAGINKTQALINAITRGENITSVQSIVNKLASDARSVQIVKNIIAESVGGIQTLMTALTLGETLKGIQATTNNLPDNISGVEQLKIQISSGVQSVQGLLGALVSGDNIKGVQAILDKLASDTKGLQSLKGILSDGIQDVQSLVNALTRGDNIKGVQAILDKLASDTRGLQSLKGILSDGIQDVQSLVNALTRGDNIKGVQAILDKLADNSGGVHLLLNLVAEGVDSFQKILITLSGEPAQGIKALLLQLHPSDLIQNMQVLINEMYEQQIQFHSTSYEIYLDGSPISKKTTSAVIDYSQSSIHNTITITSADMNLFQISDPQTLSGQSRIEVQIDGSRVIYFLLETRSGDERFFELWGRSISARDDAPYANDSDFTLSGPQLASSIAESLPVYAAVDWETTDWVVPDEFEYSGTPIDGISKLAQAIGAVVRCQDDGSLTVRNRYPVRPVNMDAATADSDYDRQDILKLNYKFNEKSGYNAVIVTGKTTDVYSPDIEVEESSPIVGDTVHVRVYWADKKPSTISPYVTDGTITDLGDFEETLTETLDFKEGIATVSKPIESVSTTTWIGDLGGSVAYVVNEKDVIIADNAFRVGTVKYTTKYQRFRLTGHSVTQLLAVLMYSDIPDVYVKVKTSAEDENLAPMISESLLSTDEAAIQRGTAELDNILYDSQEIPIRIAYNVNNVDGNLVYINDPKIDHSGNYHIDSAKIIFNKIQVINEIEAHKCLVS